MEGMGVLSQTVILQEVMSEEGEGEVPSCI